jgi:hypothetical protein
LESGKSTYTGTALESISMYVHYIKKFGGDMLKKCGLTQVVSFAGVEIVSFEGTKVLAHT